MNFVFELYTWAAILFAAVAAWGYFFGLQDPETRAAPPSRCAACGKRWAVKKTRDIQVKSSAESKQLWRCTFCGNETWWRSPPPEFPGS